jgi:hypothetical protein
MAIRSKKKTKEKELPAELDAILRRVDRLPDMDSRTLDEIIGYDKDGLPRMNTTPSSTDASAHDAGDATEDPDIENWRKAFGREISPVVKGFLEHRHREWELAMEADLDRRSKTRRLRTRGPAR